MNSDTQDKCSIFNRRVCLSNNVWISLLIYFIGIINVSAVESTSSVAKITVKPLSALLGSKDNSVAATVISLNQPILRAQITASVISIHVEVGDQVKQGEVLLKLDCREYEYALQQAKANYETQTLQINLLRKNYQRDQQLMQQSTISATRFDQSETNYLSAQAEIKALSAQKSLAQLQVERCQIKAPFTGEIIQRQVQYGQLINNQTALLTLLQSNNLQLSAKLTHIEIATIRQAKQIMFRQAGEDHHLKLSTVISLADEKTRTQELRFSLLDQDNALVTGSAGRIIWKNPYPTLPAAYLSKRNNRLGVFMLKDENPPLKAIFVPLPQAQEGRDVSIDLPLKSLIIDVGRLKIHDQQVVKIQ